MIKYLFDPLSLSKNWNQSIFIILAEFSPSTLQLREFSHFNHFS